MYHVFYRDYDIKTGQWYDMTVGQFDSLEEAERCFNSNVDYYRAIGKQLYLEKLPVEEYYEIW